MSFVRLGLDEVFVDVVSSDGPPVIFCAGGGAPGTSMRGLAATVQGSCQAVIWDRANLGLSDVVIRGASELELWADQLAALVEKLDLEPVYLAAASEGTRVAIRAALKYPDKVRGLFLWQVSSGPIMNRLREAYHLKYARLAQMGGMSGVVRSDWGRERVKWNPKNLDRLMELDPLEFAKIKERWADELSPDETVPGHTDEELRSVRSRTWIIRGVDDSHPPERSDHLASLLPKGQLVPAPYTREQFDRVRHGSLWDGWPNSLILYAALPGIPHLLKEFVSDSGTT